MPVEPGNDLPQMTVVPPGPSARAWLARAAESGAPMGPRRTPGALGGLVYARGTGNNVYDSDGNRFVDLAAGFGALLIGHSHPAVVAAVEVQARLLLQALGDVYPSALKIELSERLARLHPEPGARVILGQSGADAVSAALKTARLATGKPGVVAFSGAYHGLSYGPLAACGLRASYREPFADQLNPHVRFLEYPAGEPRLAPVLDALSAALARGDIGCVLVEPVLGRGGCIVPPNGFLSGVAERARQHGALLVVDEVWTGLGRAGAWLASTAEGVVPDLWCIGKGLGGGVPISACVGSARVMAAWSRDEEVVHTSTFAGAPLACAAAIATLGVLEEGDLVTRAARVGATWMQALRAALPGGAVRGRGLMVAIDLGDAPGRAVVAMNALAREGYIVSTGGGRREVVVLTPPLNIGEHLLEASLVPLGRVFRELCQ